MVTLYNYRILIINMSFREMEAEWRRKTAEAEQREERVRWRRRRMELRGKRIVFWRRENRRVENGRVTNIGDLNQGLHG